MSSRFIIALVIAASGAAAAWTQVPSRQPQQVTSSAPQIAATAPQVAASVPQNELAPATLTTPVAPEPAPAALASDSAESAPPARRRVAASRSNRVAVQQRAPRRSWKKTALVVGGSTAAGAGLGALVGGKKGALIGAAVGGGAGTVYEVRKRHKRRR